MAAKIGLRPPRSLNPAEVESKKKTARSELKKMTTDADAEIAKFMARMAEKKAWSRIEEIKQEESVAGAAKAEAARRAAAAQERAAAFQGLLGGVPVEDEAPKADESAILEAARLREVLAQANALAERALANRAAKVAAEAAAKATKEWDGGGLFGGLFGGWGGGGSGNGSGSGGGGGGGDGSGSGGGGSGSGGGGSGWDVVPPGDARRSPSIYGSPIRTGSPIRAGSPPKVLSLSSASPCMQVLTTAPCPPQVLSLSSVSPQQLEAVAEAEAEAEAEEAFAPWGELGAVAAPRALCERKRLGWPRMAADCL
jgi:hypothetical protein